MECSNTSNLTEIARVGEKLCEVIDFNNKLIAAINTSIEGIALLDENGIYLWMNKAHERMFGYDEGELIGKSWTELYRDTDIEQFIECVFPIVEMTGSWHGEATAISKDGKTKVKEVLTLTALPDGGLICTCRNKYNSDDL